MRTTTRLVVVLVFVAMAVSALFVHAQDATATAPASATGSMVSCDSDLILSLYVAERYFGFAGAMDMMMKNSTDTSAMVDVNTINKGQFAPLFDGMMGMMDQNMMMPGTNMTQEQMQSMSSTMGMSDADMMTQMQSMLPAGTDMSSMTMLNSSSVAGEDASCTKLRTQLNHFYTALVFQDMQAGMGVNSGTGTNTEATTEASTNGNTEATPEATP